jgi:asparagine synthase (glutamine-hydrolysing)
VLRIDHDFLANYGAFVDKTVLVTDGCFGAIGAHEVYLNAKARELAPIRLTGNFGSEILRSMSTFKPLALTPELFSPEYAPLIAASGRTSPGSTAHPVTFSAFREIPSSLFGSLAAGRSQVIFRTPYLDNDIVSLAYRAPIRARTSPDAALHLIGRAHPPLGRIPTDRGLIAGASGWSGVLRRLFAEVTFKLDYLHKEGMPHRLSGLDPVIDRLSHLGVLGLHKYLPYRRWFRKEASGYVNDVLTDPGTLRMPYWRKGSVATIAADHIGGRRNYVREINAVLTLEAADRLLVRGCAS